MKLDTSASPATNILFALLIIMILSIIWSAIYYQDKQIKRNTALIKGLIESQGKIIEIQSTMSKTQATTVDVERAERDTHTSMFEDWANRSLHEKQNR